MPEIRRFYGIIIGLYNGGHNATQSMQMAYLASVRDKKVFTDFALDGWTISWLNEKIDLALEHGHPLGQKAEKEVGNA